MRFGLAVALLVLFPRAALGASFLPLGGLDATQPTSLPLALSGDGNFAVARSNGPFGADALRWTASRGVEHVDGGNGIVSRSCCVTTLTWPTGISRDGSAIVGFGSTRLRSGPVSWTREGRVRDAFLWTEDRGVEFIGNPVGSVRDITPAGVSDDARIVVGSAQAESGQALPQAFVWESGRGMSLIGDQASGQGASGAVAVSGGGDAAVGWVETDQGRDVFRWTQDSGMQILGLIGSESLSFTPTDMALGGDVISGSRIERGRTQAFVFREMEGFVDLGPIFAGALSSGISALSADGRVAAGIVSDGTTSQTVIWSEGRGTQFLEILLASNGVMPDGWSLLGLTDISDDGRTVLGTGLNPDGRVEAFVAVVPEPSTTLLVCLGLASLSLYGRRPATA